MLKNLSQLEHKIGDKVYQFFCDNNSPISEVKESLFQFLKFIGHIEDQAKAMEASKPVETPKVEPIQEQKVE